MRNLSILLFPFALLLATTSAARTSDLREALDWYQVEVIIFSQQDLFDNERHATDIKLSYPENIRQLIAVGEDNNPDQSNISKLPIGADYVSSSNDVQNDNAFVELPDNLFDMNDDHKRLDRAAGYRVLYHKAWRQPGLGKDDAPWILIQGGEAAGDHHELEGSIRLVRNRYLHVQANLWKTRFGEPSAYSPINHPKENSNTQYASDSLALSPAPTITPETAQWPPLPPIPVTETVDTAPDSNAVLNTVVLNKADNETDNTDNLAIKNSSTHGEGGQGASTSINTLSYQPMVYSIKDIVTLNQSTRLSRDKLTYLDHPNMGVIILVKKYGSDADSISE